MTIRSVGDRHAEEGLRSPSHRQGLLGRTPLDRPPGILVGAGVRQISGSRSIRAAAGCGGRAVRYPVWESPDQDLPRRSGRRIILCPRVSIIARPSGSTSTSFANTAVEGAVDPTATWTEMGPTRSSDRSSTSDVKVSTSGRPATERSSGHSRRKANGSTTVEGTGSDGSCTHLAVVVVASGVSTRRPPSMSAECAAGCRHVEPDLASAGRRPCRRGPSYHPAKGPTAQDGCPVRTEGGQTETEGERRQETLR